MSVFQNYSESLAKLSGDDFQVEVCARLQSVILGFQTVPSEPQGDAGLDGFSHGGQRGYCCYGPEHNEFKTSKERETAIIKKFKSDLRRLFELEFQSKSLVQSDSPEMESILPNGQRIEHIELISNWFESHRILNPILTAVNEYKLASKCRYIDSGKLSVRIVGPKELANRYAVDEITIVRAEQRIFVKSVRDAAIAVTINPKDFDFKMNVLREIRPTQVAAIDALTGQLRANWRMAIAFDKKLDETLPSLHQILEENRKRVLTRVAELMLASPEPWTQLGQAENIAQDILKEGFGIQYSDLIAVVSSGEIARLIGECPIGWEAPRAPNV